MHAQMRFRLVGVAVVIGTLALGACGGPASAVTRPTGAPSSSTATATGVVLLQPDAAAYATTDAITITVRNGLAKSIFMLDNHTACTVVQLEQESGNGWRAVGACLGAQPHPHVVEIPAGARVTVDLTPQQDSSLSGGWPAGTNRAALTYVTSSTEAIEQGTTVYSQPFAVG